MNIKSLLIGSAAALTVVSGANAADAIVAAEPEPLEYVRVCDAFGTGYFYIPGTETCLKIGGYVRADFKGGRPGALVARNHLIPGDADYKEIDGGLETSSRFMLNVSTASDTEYGALKTYSEVRFNVSNGQDDSADKVVLAFSYIDLAGFRVGIDESAFVTFPGYLGNVIDDDIIAAGPYRTALISYSYEAGNGFSGVVSLEHDENADVTTYTFDANGRAVNTGTSAKPVYGTKSSRSNYAPNVVAGVGYSSGAFGLKVVGGYDAEAEEGAVKARIDGTFGAVTAFVAAGWSTDGDRVAKYTNANSITGRRSVLGSNYYATWGGDWAVWAGVSAPINEKTTFNTQVSYDDNKNLAAVANVAFTVVPGFVITPEVVYAKIDDTGLPANVKDDVLAGKVRFQRSF
ncbi:porin [Rhizobium sp. CFBP 8762]|uniref:porin n=1 Tax=Rhizobium sp. CFBP 8762 TaxID=2775279 RepID=UPI001781BC8A|nr:porin [Rhizobium sp. CFBP 8762]MBD8553122.1 porin [Rhizobium sp. CFBP 8762]